MVDLALPGQNENEGGYHVEKRFKGLFVGLATLHRVHIRHRTLAG
jgi:hypothetical protein